MRQVRPLGSGGERTATIPVDVAVRVGVTVSCSEQLVDEALYYPEARSPPATLRLTPLTRPAALLPDQPDARSAGTRHAIAATARRPADVRAITSGFGSGNGFSNTA
jgi:hypothetical protein